MQKLHRQCATVPFYRPGDVRKAFELRIIPEPGKPHGRVDRVLVDQVTAKNDHSQTSLGALFVVGDRLFGKDSFMRRADPSRTYGSERHAIRKGGVSDPQRRKQVRIVISAHSLSLDTIIIASPMGSDLRPLVNRRLLANPMAPLHPLVAPKIRVVFGIGRRSRAYSGDSKEPDHLHLAGRVTVQWNAAIYKPNQFAR
jgi:hypothetical protein